MKPAWELGSSGVAVVRSYPWLFGLLGVGACWWIWPWLPGLPRASASGPGTSPEVITTFVEDPQRTIAAIALWKQRPGSLLVLQGQPSSQASSRSYLENQGKWPADERGILMLKPGCDTFGQLRALQRWLGQRQVPGRLTVVTSPAHLPRSLAIARILLGSQGWTVEGLPVVTGDNRPENTWRMVRDQARAQLFRATGMDLGVELVCRQRFAESS